MSSRSGWIADILGDIEHQQAAAAVARPVAEEQTIASTILQQNLSRPDFQRRELRELRTFLKQPLVGASVAVLRQTLKEFSVTSDLQPLVQLLRSLRTEQEQVEPERAPNASVRLTRQDLHLVCYEYINA